MVIRVKTFRFRVYPTFAQIERLKRWNDALRFLWNLAMEQRRMGYDRPRGERVYPSYFSQNKELTELRADLPWLADVPRNVCCHLLLELDIAWQRCFKKLGFGPRWKKKGATSFSFCEPHPKVWRLSGSTLRFPKLGDLRAVAHRLVEGKPKTCTIKCDAGQWFATIICEIEAVELTARSGPVVALDRGVVNVIGDSDGRLVPSPRFYEKAMVKLAMAQRSVSRKKKGSKNREKAKARVSILHRKVRRQREHFLHVLSHGYAKSHGVVVIEDLQIDNMVMVSNELSRGILDAGWGLLRWMLDYKLTWSGGCLEHEIAAYSSQTCSACGCVDARSRASQSLFRCTSCGHVEHADINASKVLKQRYETRANRSGKPVEGIAPKATRRSRKPVTLRVPRSITSSAHLRRG